MGYHDGALPYDERDYFELLGVLRPGELCLLTPALMDEIMDLLAAQLTKKNRVLHTRDLVISWRRCSDFYERESIREIIDSDEWKEDAWALVTASFPRYPEIKD